MEYTEEFKKVQVKAAAIIQGKIDMCQLSTEYPLSFLDFPVDFMRSSVLVYINQQNTRIACVYNDKVKRLNELNEESKTILTQIKALSERYLEITGQVPDTTFMLSMRKNSPRGYTEMQKESTAITDLLNVVRWEAFPHIIAKIPHEKMKDLLVVNVVAPSQKVD